MFDSPFFSNAIIREALNRHPELPDVIAIGDLHLEWRSDAVGSLPPLQFVSLRLLRFNNATRIIEWECNALNQELYKKYHPFYKNFLKPWLDYQIDSTVLEPHLVQQGWFNCPIPRGLEPSAEGPRVVIASIPEEANDG